MLSNFKKASPRALLVKKVGSSLEQTSIKLYQKKRQVPVKWAKDSLMNYGETMPERGNKHKLCLWEGAACMLKNNGVEVKAWLCPYKIQTQEEKRKTNPVLPLEVLLRKLSLKTESCKDKGNRVAIKPNPENESEEDHTILVARCQGKEGPREEHIVKSTDSPVIVFTGKIKEHCQKEAQSESKKSSSTSSQPHPSKSH